MQHTTSLSVFSQPLAPSPNLRRSKRVALHVDVTVDDATNFYTGFAENVSAGGLFVATYQLKPIGTEVELTFVLPGETSDENVIVCCVGVVRWIRDPHDLSLSPAPGIGIQFSDLTREERVAIERFVHRCTPLFYPD